jgi:hypothetical protein
MNSITIPVGEPMTFDSLRRLNPSATVEQLSAAFEELPEQLRAEAWSQMRLKVALACWDAEAAENGNSLGD